MSDRQPTRSRRVVPARRFDKTQLRASGHGRVVHRDYASHALRWNFTALLASEIQNSEIKPWTGDYMHRMLFKFGWVGRYVKQGMRILDVGCGQDQPLLYVLGNKMQTVPELYVGVDLNNIPRPSQVKWSRIHANYNFVDDGLKLLEKYGVGSFDLATNFEVIEHMMPVDGKRLLENIFAALKPGGKLLLSTPVFDGAAAANHVHEYTIPELKELVESVGFVIERRFGTFASKRDIRWAMEQTNDSAAIECYDRLSKWFGDDVMSTFMAPMYPDASRNNMWICVKP